MDFRTRNAIEIFVKAIAEELMPWQFNREVERQRNAYLRDGVIIGALSPAQEMDQAENLPFKPDVKEAEHRAKIQLESGIGIRLHGAYACYKAGKGMECVRHLMLAFSVVSSALGWEDVTAYLLEQNDNLLARVRKSA